MPYKKQFYKTIEFKKSLVVGVMVLILDIFGHTLFTARPETFYYYLLKPLISGYIVFYMFKFKKRFAKDYGTFELEERFFRFYIFFSLLFAFIHGIYYRILDFIQGNPFWARVQDVIIGDMIWSRNNFVISIMAWTIIHGGVFLISIFIADFLERKKWLN